MTKIIHILLQKLKTRLKIDMKLHYCLIKPSYLLIDTFVLDAKITCWKVVLNSNQVLVGLFCLLIPHKFLNILGLAKSVKYYGLEGVLMNIDTTIYDNNVNGLGFEPSILHVRIHLL